MEDKLPLKENVNFIFLPIIEGFLKIYKINKKKIEFIRSPIKNADYSDRYNMTRGELMADHLNEFIRIHKQFANFKATR